MFKNKFLILLKTKKIITNNKLGKKYKKILYENIEILQKIIEFTTFLQYDAPISSRIYCLIKNITDQPTCTNCKKPLKMRTSGKVRWTFGKFCGGACIGRDKTVRQKYKTTNLKKYGYENTFQVEKFKEKAKITMIERYGVENAAQSKTIYAKIKQTNLNNRLTKLNQV